MTEYVKIESTDELSSWENRILELFRKSFGRPLSPEAWRWMYLNNPNGLAYVTLAIENGQLSGHYAAVPTLLADAAGPFVAYRSMTTMVDPDSSAPGLFLRLGRRAHEELTQSGIKLIYGFPNANSAFTFERFMRWRMVEAHEIADVPGRAILGSPGIRADLLTRGPVRWNLEDAGQAAWRLSEDLPADLEVATAAFWAAEAGHRVAHTTVHVHGGVGIDTDHPVHRYFISAKQTEFALGGATAHLRLIGRELADTPA